VSTLDGGLTTWEQAVAGPLAAATCLWQDLDGLHVQAPPATPPPTSILWAWTSDATLLRARLDGDTVYLARWRGEPAGAVVQPWPSDDARVGAYRPADATAATALAERYVQVIVYPDTDDTAGPLAFIRPAGPHHG
jgi:hypothetical protein